MSNTNRTDRRNNTLASKRARLARLEAEYSAASAEAYALPPEGTPWATRDEVIAACGRLYLGAISALRRELGIC